MAKFQLSEKEVDQLIEACQNVLEKYEGKESNPREMEWVRQANEDLAHWSDIQERYYPAP
ncbi:hypothetical protein SEA_BEATUSCOMEDENTI_48 [Arthrobacter phage BeatusComedenti]|uniref:Uncharacterized protein n=1 Tax=Arthrobacter phage BeatusComedenti TaxID=2656523 RepID=A0A649VVC5_9CAUD|nr:hypothetical protein SEA_BEATUSCOMEDENTI_48 [Arthrobacter phage BeatusComedenti]